MRSRPVLRRTPLVALVLVCAIAGASPAGDAAGDPDRRFATRVIKVDGPLGSPAVRSHVRFSLSIGFNAVWVPSRFAAAWTAADAPDGPRLEPEFLALARESRSSGVGLLLVMEPVRDHDGSFVFSDERQAARLDKLMRIARRDAGVHDFVLSFFDTPLQLTELGDRLDYGPSAARAQVALARALARRLRGDDRLWLEPSVTSDRFLGDPELPYSVALLEALDGLDRRVGIVWSGPQPISPELTVEQVRAAETRFGGRKLLFDDRYPANGSEPRIPLALVLGPLRARAPAVADRIDTYAVTPMTELGASRLALLTIADFLTDPDGYDADASWERAKRRLAGEDERAYEALRTQAAEWGGWVGTRNYHTAADENPRTAAASLADPAAFAAWIWPVRTYPGRIDELAGLDDTLFRDELLLTMARRLAVARAAAPARRLLVPETSVEEAAEARRSIERQRAGLSGEPAVRVALDRFLVHAGLGALIADGPPPVPLP
ncbi:MAG TPA: beta-N-acetylglucosaminidase domain-containing protein [Candidatus Polarisedimenticolaceae bacterium]|nr:beta-N-acetylglucosaminidase domain-containing protein [Candidatus Polarisedimenticolaceae bacterium]